MVALGEGPSSPPDPPKTHGGVASGQCRLSCARSVREPSIWTAIRWRCRNESCTDAEICRRLSCGNFCICGGGPFSRVIVA